MKYDKTQREAPCIHDTKQRAPSRALRIQSCPSGIGAIDRSVSEPDFQSATRPAENQFAQKNAA